jgi:hypothetical protein
MRKILSSVLFISLFLSLVSTSAIAKEKDHKVKIKKETIVAGQVLQPGSYIAEINEEGNLVLLKGKKVMVEAVVDIEPLGNVNPNSYTVDRNGVMGEIRFLEEKVVFPTLSNVGRTAE